MSRAHRLAPEECIWGKKRKGPDSNYSRKGSRRILRAAFRGRKVGERGGYFEHRIEDRRPKTGNGIQWHEGMKSALRQTRRPGNAGRKGRARLSEQTSSSRNPRLPRPHRPQKAITTPSSKQASTGGETPQWLRAINTEIMTPCFPNFSSLLQLSPQPQLSQGSKSPAPSYTNISPNTKATGPTPVEHNTDARFIPVGKLLSYLLLSMR